MNDPRIPWIAARQSGQERPSPLDIFLSGLATQQGQRQGAPGMTPLQQEQVAQSRALFPERQRQAELETDTQAAQLGGAQATAGKAVLQMHEEALKFAVHMSQDITPENYAVRRAAIVQLYPDAKDTLGEQYDPAQIARFQKEGLEARSSSRCRAKSSTMR